MLIPFGVFSAAGAGGGAAAGAYELISSTILTGTQASVTFDVTGLGSTYKHLQVRLTARSTATNYSNEKIGIRLNSNTGNNYSSHVLFGNGSSVYSATSGSSVAIMEDQYVAGGGASSNIFGAVIADFLDPFSSTKNKTVRTFFGNTAGPIVGLSSGVFLSTSATTSITFSPATIVPGTWVAGSRFSIYGVK